MSAQEPPRAMNSLEHSIQRARERYGLSLTVKDMARLRDACRDRKGVYLGLAIGNDRPAERWLMQVQGATVIVLYSRPGDFVLTFLPQDDRVAKRRREKAGKRRQRRSAAWPDERRALCAEDA